MTTLGLLPAMAHDSKRPLHYLIAGLVAGALFGALGTSAWLGNPPHDGARAKQTERSTKRNKLSRGKASPDRLAGYSRERLSSEFVQLSEGTDRKVDFDLMKDLAERVADFAPESALETALQIEDPIQQRGVLERLFHRWAGKDPAAAYEAMESIENLALRRHVFRQASRSLAVGQPEATIQLIEANPGFGDEDTWGRAFGVWATRDPEAATEKLLALKSGSLKREALHEMASQLGREDLDTALEWTETLAEEDRAVAMEKVLHRAASIDPEQVAEQLPLLGTTEAQTDVASRVARAWAERDTEAAMAWAETLEGEMQGRAFSQIASEMLEIDPTAAETLARRIESPEERGSVMKSIARLRLGSDPAQARDWIEGLPESDRAAAWNGAANEWASLDPKAAGTFASETNDPTARKQLVEALAHTWPRHDPATAAQWASTLTEGQSGAMTRILDTWSRDSPDEAAAFVATQLGGELQGEMTGRVVGRWVREDASAAADWAETLPPGDTRKEAYQSLTRQWLQRDSLGASEWVAGLPSGHERDSAVATLINYIEREDPNAALAWAGTLSDEAARASAAKRLQRRLEKR